MPNFFRNIERHNGDPSWYYSGGQYGHYIDERPHYYCDAMPRVAPEFTHGTPKWHKTELVGAHDLVCNEHRYIYTTDSKVYTFDCDLNADDAEKRSYKTPLFEANFAACQWKPIWQYPTGQPRLIVARLTERENCMYEWWKPDHSYVGLVCFDGARIHCPAMPDTERRDKFTDSKYYDGVVLTRAFAWAEVPDDLANFTRDGHSTIKDYMADFMQAFPGKPMPGFPEHINQICVQRLTGIGDSWSQYDAGTNMRCQGYGIRIPGLHIIDKGFEPKCTHRRMYDSDVVFFEDHNFGKYGKTITLHDGANWAEEFQQITLDDDSMKQCIETVLARDEWRRAAPYYLKHTR